jgi:hypothetical protein
VSSRYEVVFACFLRDDTPDEILEALRWHLGQIADRPPELDAAEHPDRLLNPDPASPLPGGDIASLLDQPTAAMAETGSRGWGLFSRTLWPEDAMTEMGSIIQLVAPYVAEPGYGGHYREEHATEAVAFAFGDADAEPPREPRGAGADLS